MFSSSTRRRLRTASGFAVSVALLAQPSPSAQSRLRTPDGRPDFQGMWLNDTATPLERPREFADKAALTEEEARDYERRYQLDRTAAASRVDPVFELDAAGDLDTYEPGRLLPGRRTSQITDPADGRVPSLTAPAQQRLSARNEHLKLHYADNPEDFPNTERCLLMANASAPPMLPVYYNNNLQIVQTPDYIMLLSEMIHDARMIPLGRRAHLPSHIGQWKGDSIGHWDGDTLVVETTNFTDKTTLRGSGTGLRVTERFSLRDVDTITYQFTVDDPESFVRPWSGDSLLSRTNGQMYEYACHEANYSLSNVLRGARFQETRGATKN